MTKEQYQKIYPGGCPFKEGDKLTMLTREEYSKKVRTKDDFFYKGVSPKIGFGSSGWVVKNIRSPKEYCNHWITEILVETPTGGNYCMGDIEFAEFYKNKPEIVSEYQIY